MALFHYGEAWKRFNGLMSFTELAVESFLQLSVQFCVFVFFTHTGRQPTFFQLFTIATSSLTISLGAGKAVAISTVLPNDNPKRRVIRRVKNVIWNVIFLTISIGSTGLPPGSAISVAIFYFKSFTTLYKIVFITLWSIQLFYFIKKIKNHLEKSRQAWLKCIMLSVYYFYTCISYGITFLVLAPPLQLSKFIILSYFIFVALFYLYASFNVLKIRDVLNLEVMESRHKCPVPNILLIISLILIVLNVSVWVFQGMLYSD